jgi:methylthioribose-1-phosphate isomerase
MADTTRDIRPPVPVAQWIGDACGGHLRLLDQTRLPDETAYLDCHDQKTVWDAIRRLVVRGAPAIGVAAAYGLVVAARGIPDGDNFLTDLASAADYLADSRPTAVNLRWALDRMIGRACGELDQGNTAGPSLRQALLDEARDIHQEDAALCLAIGNEAAPLIQRSRGVLTHCNAGALATGGIGTATAGMYVAHAAGHPFQVYCDETRPLLQGSRLTAWELARAGIDATVITDSMAAQVMREGRVDMVITGADRIAANGDAANKIGTYTLAICARRHEIPFYVAAPYSTFDLSLASGEDIPIEQRGGDEITAGFGRRTAPDGIKTYAPAFDVTPADLITAIITDRGTIQPVDEAHVRKVIGSGA